MTARPAIALLALSLTAAPALAQQVESGLVPVGEPPPAANRPPTLQLAVRRCSPASTGFNPMAVDNVMRQALASVALAKDAPFVLSREYEADVVASLVGHRAAEHLELVFFLETTGATPLSDTVTVDLSDPNISLQKAEEIVRLLVLRGAALKAQALLQPADATAHHTSEALAAATPRDEDEAEAEAPQTSPLPAQPGQEGLTAFMPVRPPPQRSWGLVDVTVTGGLNTPAGYAGGRIELHAGNYGSATAAFGYSSWGPRVTPGLRLYPFGLRLLGLYAEAVLAVSLGEATKVRRGGGVVEDVQLEQVLSLGGLLGLRRGFMDHFTADVFIGFTAPLTTKNARLASGDPLDADLLQALEGRQPGGLVAGAAIGVSLF